MDKNPIIKNRIPIEWKHDDTNEYLTIQICNYYLEQLKQWDYPKNFGQYWRLYWNERSGAQVVFQDVVYNLTPNRVLLIPPHVATSTRLNHEVPHFSINFTVNGLSSGVRHKIFVMRPDYIRQVLPGFYRIRQESARVMLMQSIAAYYFSKIPKEDYQLTEYEDMDPRIAQAVAILENRITNPPSNSDLCRMINMSRNNFHRLFLKETQKTPGFFLNELRMIRATNLLLNTNKTMDEIAAAVGLRDRYYFSRAFKKFTGKAPMIYKKTGPIVPPSPSR